MRVTNGDYITHRVFLLQIGIMTAAATARLMTNHDFRLGQIVRITRPDHHYGRRGHLLRVTDSGDCTVRFPDGRQQVYHARWLAPGSLF